MLIYTTPPAPPLTHTERTDTKTDASTETRTETRRGRRRDEDGDGDGDRGEDADDHSLGYHQNQAALFATDVDALLLPACIKYKQFLKIHYKV